MAPVRLIRSIDANQASVSQNSICSQRRRNQTRIEKAKIMTTLPSLLNCAHTVRKVIVIDYNKSQVIHRCLPQILTFHTEEINDAFFKIFIYFFYFSYCPCSTNLIPVGVPPVAWHLLWPTELPFRHSTRHILLPTWVPQCSQFPYCPLR